MFVKHQVELVNSLTEKEIPLFVHDFLQQVDIFKVQVEPTERKIANISILKEKNIEKIKQEINEFIIKWEDKKDEGITIQTVIVSEPNLNTLCTCNTPKNKKNIVSDLFSKKWLTLLKGHDVGYSENIFKLLNLFDKKFMEIFSGKYNDWEEKYFNPLINKEYLEKMGYFNTSANHMFMAAHLNTNLKMSEEFYKITKDNKGLLTEKTNGFLSTPEYILQTAPCFKIYFSLENTILKENKVFSIIGDCFRNEGKRAFLLERLNSFKMREFVFVGTKDFVIENRNKSLELTIKLLDYFGVKCETELANDPFFLNDDVLENKNFNIPDKVKYEIRSEIPHKQESISVASFDTHGNFFSEIFNIKLENQNKIDEPVWTGCIGLGLERCVWSFLQQYGVDEFGWPENIREELHK